MEVKEFEGKNLDVLIEDSLKELNLSKDDVLIKDEEIKSGLLKKVSYKIKIYTLTEIQNYIKKYLLNLTKKMGLEVTFESKIRDSQIYISMFSDNNSILIGKDGKTLSALTFVVKQVVNKEIGIYPHILLDVENYKNHQEQRLERLAKNLGREVKQTKVEVEMDNMNSYERRIIHNILSNNKYVYTESIGEEPNRHIIIKLKNIEEKEEE